MGIKTAVKRIRLIQILKANRLARTLAVCTLRHSELIKECVKLCPSQMINSLASEETLTLRFVLFVLLKTAWFKYNKCC